MSLQLETSLTEKIERQYESNMKGCPLKKQETDAWIAQADPDEAVCMRFLYAYMHPCDMVSYPVETLASYVKAALAMRREISYAKQVPGELFLNYVLFARVNNEDLDGSRGWIYEQLCPRVKEKQSMAEAALEVNYWCYEKATYIPSDGRTLAPIGMCRSAKGRCGEESTLAVSAMRSVGIPARQCYVPRWAHCDDNHAWVEVWTDGEWHYLGACEPEAVLDKGWFSAAASKAMLVHAKAPSDLSSGEAAYGTPLYSLMNVTERYADCVRLSVTVTENGVPLANVPVAFCLVNYSELFPIYQEKTDSEGRASFLTGKGDLYVCAVYNGRYHGSRVNMRKQQKLVLEMEKGFIPEKIESVLTEIFDLNPPIETMPKAQTAAQREEHERRLAQCEAIRAAYEAGFVKGDIPKSEDIAEKAQKADEKKAEAPREHWKRFYASARGNVEEIRRFREMDEFAEEDKLLLLDTLRPKDFVDTEADALASYLRASLPYKNTYSPEVYQNYVLAPRVATEKLNGNRPAIIKQLKASQTVFETAKQVWEYLNTHLTKLPDHGMKNLPADAAGCLKYGVCTESCLRTVFVEICRAIGLPARLNPVTRKPEAVIAANGEVTFAEMADKSETAKDGRPTGMPKLTLVNGEKTPLEYGLHFSIARFEDGEYHTLNYFGTEVKDKTVLTLPAAGSYRVITTQRQIDGGVSAILSSFCVKDDCTFPLKRAESKTKEKLHAAPLADTQVQLIGTEACSITAESAKKSVSMKSLCAGRKTILIFAEPGKEPTEHLLQEILECQTAYRTNGYRLIIALSDTAGLGNETLQKVLAAGLDLTCVLCTDAAYVYALHEALHVGDERLPYAIAIAEDGCGLFAFANYNIRTAWTLMEIFQAHSEICAGK